MSGWPKLTSDWTVANPVAGSFGTLGTDSSAKKDVIGLTRGGDVLAYSTSAPDCSPGSWPRFHHDNANSGDYARDATAPGRPYDSSVASRRLAFTAPGDDLLCGRAAKYEIVTSSKPITGADFAQLTPLAGAPQPADAGTRQSFALPAGVKRYLAIRALDEQGSAGPPEVVKTR